MFEFKTRDIDNVVKEEIEESLHFTTQNTPLKVDFDSSVSDEFITVSDAQFIKENLANEEVKFEKDIGILLTTVPIVGVDIKIELQETRDTINCCTTQHDKHNVSPIGFGKEKKKKLHSGKRKQEIKSLQKSGSTDKKKTLSANKPKHKKYEKPNDQVLKHYQCTICPKVFQRASNFNAHQRTHNPLTARPFSCQDCKNTFHYRCQLRDHARIHTGERPFKCHSCSKTFARKGCLVAHMVTHSDALPFQCEICCKRFARKYNLAKHVQSHSGDRPYRCLSCSRRFKCKQSLDKHHRIHELNIYSCAICQQSFDTKRRLTHHKINEHVSYRPFTCQICHKPFIFKSQLTYHIKEHNLERPYSCGKCNKSYFKKGHLLSHIKQYCSDTVPVPQVKLEVLT